MMCLHRQFSFILYYRPSSLSGLALYNFQAYTNHTNIIVSTENVRAIKYKTAYTFKYHDIYVPFKCFN